VVHIEGRNPVLEAIKGNRNFKKILIQEGLKGSKIELIIEEAHKMGIPVEMHKKSKMDTIALSHSHQGIIAFTEPLNKVLPEDILELARDKGEEPFIIILDQIQDPQNFGSIIRTALSAGAHGLIYQKNRAAKITPVVIKASAGASEHLMLSEVNNINSVINILKENGVWIAGTDLDGINFHFNSNLSGPIGIVIGNEGYGLRRLVKENCDFLIKIPMKGSIGSLNASVAAGIIIFEVVRQRYNK
jgi:23S rRNA (guanosine2251-2'-O)-methyltransferase